MEKYICNGLDFPSFPKKDGVNNFMILDVGYPSSGKIKNKKRYALLMINNGSFVYDKYGTFDEGSIGVASLNGSLTVYIYDTLEQFPVWNFLGSEEIPEYNFSIFGKSNYFWSNIDVKEVSSSGLAEVVKVGQQYNIVEGADIPEILDVIPSKKIVQDLLFSPLQAKATSTDEGELLFEWHESNKNYNTDLGVVSTDPRFYPSTDEIGTRYYYALVINSKSNTKTLLLTMLTFEIEVCPNNLNQVAFQLGQLMIEKISPLITKK